MPDIARRSKKAARRAAPVLLPIGRRWREAPDEEIFKAPSALGRGSPLTDPAAPGHLSPMGRGIRAASD
jgi:hypothetical protein